MCSAVALVAVMLDEMEEDSDVDMDEVEDMECCLSASALALIYRAPENTTMHMNLRLLDLNRLDARFGSDEFLVENFRFRRNEIGIFMQHIRLPDVIKVNGSRYTKLEGLLCSWWRGATAAQGNKAELLFGLDRRRLSELRIHVHELLIADHRDCKILHTMAPWPDEWLDFMVVCCANVAGQYASELNTFFFLDGHFNETCRPTEYSETGIGGMCPTERCKSLRSVATHGRMA